MSRYIADTHALHWHLADDAHLSATARELLRDADAGLHQIVIPSIALIEMIYLAEKGYVEEHLLDRVLSSLGSVRGSYIVADLDVGVARAMRAIPRTAIPDMPDRIIVATAHHLGLPLISKDAKIQRAEVVPIIW